MNDEQQTFELARMSSGIRWVTMLFILLLGGVAAAIGFAAFGLGDAMRKENIPPALALAFSALIVVVFVFVWVYYRPTRFAVSEAGLTIHWPVRQRLCGAEDIASVRQVRRGEVGTPWRLWGTGGLWGLFGLCRSKHIARFDAFISRGDGLVLIEFIDTRPLLITPDDPEQFEQALAAVCSLDRADERTGPEAGHA